MKDICGRLFRRCREWAFYLVGALICELALLILWIVETPDEFVRLSRTVGIFGIAVTVAYKTIVIAVMGITRPKTALDRRLVWHLGAMDALMMYAFVANVFPEWLGLPKVPQLNPPFDPSRALIMSAVIWYNIIGFVMWSAIAVLNSLFHERFRYVRFGMWRVLKSRASEFAD